MRDSSMTKALYLTDSYVYECKGKLLFIGKDEKGPYILLDQTVFYPQGGGQPSDQGSIILEDNIAVPISFVKQFGDEIRHYTNELLGETYLRSTVTCRADQERRQLNAQYHTAGHFLSHIVETWYPTLVATKGHSFPREAYLEFSGDEKIDLEVLTNAINSEIQNKRLTKSFEILPSEFEEQFYKIPYPIPEHKAFRVLQIGDYPPIPCGGTHLLNIDEIKSIVVRKIGYKNNIVKVS